MPVKWKPITPNKANFDAIYKELHEVAKSSRQPIKQDYLAGVKDWEDEDKPTIRSKTIPKKYQIIIEVIAEGEVYAFVHDGIEGPFTIAPVNYPVLLFQEGYDRKTEPGLMESVPGGAYGETVAALEVEHPGYEGRFFSVTIKIKWEPLLRERYQEALNRGAKKSGHHMKGKIL